jgi:hypothetical protein
VWLLAAALVDIDTTTPQVAIDGGRAGAGAGRWQRQRRKSRQQSGLAVWHRQLAKIWGPARVGRVAGRAAASTSSASPQHVQAEGKIHRVGQKFAS